VARVLVLHASIDGQTARIAERIAAVLRARGLEATVLAANAPEAPARIGEHDGIVVGAGIRYGRHAAWLEKLVRAHLAQITARPNAFYSVCLSAGGPGARPATARGYLDDFQRRTGWSSAQAASFAGALLYRRYAPVIRFMMRLILSVAGGDTDTSRDYDYTDWTAVERYAEEFARRMSAPDTRGAREAVPVRVRR
jgi:menaquinone-dependent protoporphyrinogen oxidase